MNRYLRLFLIAAVALTAVAAAARKRTAPLEDNVRKAEYVFLESANYVESEQATDRYMLLRHAARLNPDDPFIAGAAAEIELLFEREITPQTPAYLRLQRRFRERPLVSAYYEPYANIAYYLEFYDDAIEVWETLDSLQPSRTDPAMNLAEMLKTKGSALGDTASILRAIGIYERLQQDQPANFNLAMAKLKAYSALSDTAAMLAELQNIRRVAPNDRLCLLGSARIYTLFNMRDSAMACFDRAGALYPSDGLVSSERAGFFYNIGDTATYRAEIAKAVESPTLEFEQKFGLFTNYLNVMVNDSSATADVRRLFNVFEEVNPGEAVLHELYGRYLSALELYAEAAEQFRFSIDLDASDVSVWDSLIEALADSHNDAATEAAATEAFELFPSDLYAALIAATGKAVRKEYEGAIEVLDRVQILPSHAPKVVSSIYTYKGDFYSNIEMPDSALVNYDRAIALDAENHMALNNAAYFMSVFDRDLSRAEVYASIACAAEPQNPTFLDTYAWVMFKKRDYVKAAELIERALAELESDSEQYFEIYSHAGDIFYMAGQPDRAVEFWEKALGYQPDDELLKRKVANRSYYYE